MNTHDQEYRFPSRYDFYLFVTGFIWGTGFPVAKFIYNDVTPLAFLAMRDLLGLLTLSIIAWLRRRVDVWQPLPRAELWKLAAWGVVGNGLSPISVFVALKFTTVGNAALLASTSPIFGFLLAALVWRRAASRAAWLGVLLSFAGIFLLIHSRFSSLGFSSQTLLGDFLCLLSPLCWAVYTTAVQSFMPGRSPLRVLLITLSAGTTVITALALPELMSTNWHAITWPSWTGIVYMAVFANALAYICWNIGIARLGSGRTIIYSYEIPVVAWLLAVMWLGESFLFNQLGAAVLVFSGVYLARRR